MYNILKLICVFNDMKLKFSDALHIFETPKRLIDIHRWEVANNRNGQSVTHKFRARIEIEGALPCGVWFRCSKIYGRESNGTFQLDQEQADYRRHIELYRLDWNPPRAHTNGLYGPKELRGIYIPAYKTHEHRCSDNYDPKTGLMRTEGLSTARCIEENIHNFNEALKYVCDRLKILNWDQIPPPIAQGDNLL